MMSDSPSNPQSQKANLARIRDNQRRSRARRKEYLSELETKYRTCEAMGVEASSAIQAAARRVLEENARLRALLKSKGLSDAEIDGFAPSGDDGDAKERTRMVTMMREKGGAGEGRYTRGGENPQFPLPSTTLETLLSTRRECKPGSCGGGEKMTERTSERGGATTNTVAASPAVASTAVPVARLARQPQQQQQQQYSQLDFGSVSTETEATMKRSPSTSRSGSCMISPLVIHNDINNNDNNNNNEHQQQYSIQSPLHHQPQLHPQLQLQPQFQPHQMMQQQQPQLQLYQSFTYSPYDPQQQQQQQQQQQPHDISPYIHHHHQQQPFLETNATMMSPDPWMMSQSLSPPSPTTITTIIPTTSTISTAAAAEAEAEAQELEDAKTATSSSSSTTTTSCHVAAAAILDYSSGSNPSSNVADVERALGCYAPSASSAASAPASASSPRTRGQDCRVSNTLVFELMDRYAAGAGGIGI